MAGLCIVFWRSCSTARRPLLASGPRSTTRRRRQRASARRAHARWSAGWWRPSVVFLSTPVSERSPSSPTGTSVTRIADAVNGFSEWFVDTFHDITPVGPRPFVEQRGGCSMDPARRILLAESPWCHHRCSASLGPVACPAGRRRRRSWVLGASALIGRRCGGAPDPTALPVIISVPDSGTTRWSTLTMTLRRRRHHDGHRRRRRRLDGTQPSRRRASPTGARPAPDHCRPSSI